MKVYKYGDNVDTDVIIPARYLNAPDEKSLASHCMEDIDASFASTVEEGDIIVAGANFGCGSSREHAPLAIKASGVKCVIAPSFARIFYRNAINIGFPILECAEAAEGIQAGDTVSVDFNTGAILDDAQGYGYKTPQKAHAAWGYKNRTPAQKAAQRTYSAPRWSMANCIFHGESTPMPAEEWEANLDRNFASQDSFMSFL